jgi:sugar lactone lactonase YvrE
MAPYRLPACWALLSCLLLPLRGQSDYATPYVFTTLAGTSSIGSADGTGSAARFYQPQGVAVDPSGNLYVADSDNETIRKISPTGVVTTLAGAPGETGGADGSGSQARFNFPSSLVVDGAGNLFVADANNHTIRKVTPAGAVTTLAGAAGVSGSADGTGGAARFNRPEGIAVDPAGNLYIADAGNHLVRKISPAGLVSTVSGSAEAAGSVDGTGSAARFGTPFRIAVDAAGTLYVTDSTNWDIRKITPGGTVTTLYYGHYESLYGRRAPTNVPTGIAVTASGRIFFADSETGTIDELGPSGEVTILAGTEGTPGSADGTGPAARFNNPRGLTADAAGYLFVADRDNNTIRKVSPAARVTTVAGLGLDASHGNLDGLGALARFDDFASIAVSPAGNGYVGSGGVRPISASGAVTTLAGTAGLSFAGMAVDSSGTIYVTDAESSVIRKITPAGIVTVLAGAPGQIGSNDGPGGEARFFFPGGITVDATGTIYVTEPWLGTIRKITPAGMVTTFAGQAGVNGSADGTGTAARFGYPLGIAADPAGNLYVTDASDNNTIRKISPAGVVTTLAGLAGTPGHADGTGSAARFGSPDGVVVDAAGNVFVNDAGNATIRKITPAGVVTTVAGLAGFPGQQDGLGRDARFHYLTGIAVDAAGTLYVTSGTTVGIGQLAGPPVITAQPQSQTVVSGGTVQLSAAAAGLPAPTFQWYYNGNPYSGATGSTLSFANARGADAGEYYVVATNSLGAATSSKATLSIAAGPASTPATTGGGGGAIEHWFILALLALGATRRLTVRDAR